MSFPDGALPALRADETGGVELVFGEAVTGAGAFDEPRFGEEAVAGVASLRSLP